MFWTECKTKTFWNAGRKGARLWILAAICLPNCPRATGLLGLWACPRPADSKASGVGADPAPELCPALSLVLSPGILARNRWVHCQGSAQIPAWAFQPPLLWSCFMLSAGFWTLKAFQSRGCSSAFLRILRFFYFITSALSITYPPVPLPDKLILPFPFFNRKPGA